MTAQAILHDLATRGVILTSTGDRLDVDGPDELLTDELLATLRERKSELLELLASGHLCPGCAGEMVLQDRERDLWWCPACRQWPEQGRPKPATRAEEKARKLLEDLKAAGCAFVIEDDELRLRFPSKMNAALWARFENAGDIFRAMAFEAAISDDAMPEDANEWLH